MTDEQQIQCYGFPIADLTASLVFTDLSCPLQVNMLAMGILSDLQESISRGGYSEEEIRQGMNRAKYFISEASALIRKTLTVGSRVTPVTEAGLELGDVPTDGNPDQERKVYCIFKGVGVIVEVLESVIDYDKWGEPYEGLGKVFYRQFLVEGEFGQGWAGEGAVRRV